MKVIKGLKHTPRKRQITIQISPKVLDKVDKQAREHSIARQVLIEAILDKAIEDPSFTIDLLPS